MSSVTVHPHALKHGLTEKEIMFAWRNFVRKQRRVVPSEDEIVAVGFTPSGQFVQMVGKDFEWGCLIFHAMALPTQVVLRELGLEVR